MLKLLKKILDFIRKVLFKLLGKKYIQTYTSTSRPEVAPKEEITSLKFFKYANNPVISPHGGNDWETWQTFNPGVIKLDDDRIHFVYRAIGNDGISRLGYACSHDGYEIHHRHPKPCYEHPEGVTKQKTPYSVFSQASGGSWGGCEDPRLVRVDDEDTIYMTYTAVDQGLRVAMSSIKVEDFMNKLWNWTPPKLISPPGEVNKNWVIFPEKINGKYVVLHSINPEILVDYIDDLNFKEGEFIYSKYGGAKAPKHRWDNWIRGAGPPPIKTDDGWLLFYHAMDTRDPGRYKVGVLLLDLNDPTKVLHRANSPVLEPDEWYENDGFKAGVVYAIGTAIIDDTLFLYYGGADSYICVAHVNLADFLTELKKDKKKSMIIDIFKRDKK